MHAQGETYYPAWVDPSGFATSATVLIYRPRDGAFLDWSSLTFKTSAWTTKEQALTLATDGLWTYATGWVLPIAFDEYRVIYKGTDAGVASSYDGGVIEATHRRAAAVNDVAGTATGFVTALTETVTDFWKDAFITFTGGVLSGQVKKITAYNGTTKAVTTNPFTGAPGNGDTFIIVNH